MSTTTSSRSASELYSRSRGSNSSGPVSTRFIVRPAIGPRGGIDLTERVVSVIADELWKRNGGNAVLNWIEAERLLLQALLCGAKSPRGFSGDDEPFSVPGHRM